MYMPVKSNRVLLISYISGLILFIIFLIFINIYNFISLVFEIDQTIDMALKNNDKKIQKIDSNFTYDNSARDQYDINVAHTANELGFNDSLYQLNSINWKSGFNILLTGADKKHFRDSKSRADVIIIIRINNQGKIFSISIPRDTLITIETKRYGKTPDKIGHSMYWGGLNQLKKSVENLIGSEIHKVVIIDNFRSFEAFLAILGGIDIDKELSGDIGIQWIRNRNFQYGDIERCKRQQVFIKKAIEKGWKISKNGNFFILDMLYHSMIKIIQTDITRNDFRTILYYLKKNNFSPENDFYTSVLQGKFGTYNSIIQNRNDLSCWLPNTNSIRKIKTIFTTNNNSILHSKDNISFYAFIKLDFHYFINSIKSKTTDYNKTILKHNY